MKKTLLLLAFLITYSVNAQTSLQQLNKSDSITSLKSDINNLKTKVEDLQIELQLIDKKVGLEQIETKDFFYDKYGKWFNLWAIIGTVLGFFLSITIISILVNRFVKNNIRKQLNSNEWFNALAKKIDKQLDQNKYKRIMKIGILSKDSENEKEMLAFFNQNEFKNVKGFVFTGDNDIYFEILKSDIHVLVLNNQNNQLDFKQIKFNNGLFGTDENTPINDLIEMIKKDKPKLSVFYFNDNSVQLPRKLNEGLISSFANSYASIYHNVLDLMRYKYKVIDGND